MSIVARVKNLTRNNHYRLTLHAEIERDFDNISIEEIEEALLSDSCELIENYPEDPRGASFLLVGFTLKGDPIHLVCSIYEDTLIIITVYLPDPSLWIEWRKRRK